MLFLLLHAQLDTLIEESTYLGEYHSFLQDAELPARYSVDLLIRHHRQLAETRLQYRRAQVSVAVRNDPDENKYCTIKISSSVTHHAGA
jgi:hypothetical protein